MRSCTIAFLLGILTLQQFGELPDIRWTAAILAVPPLLYHRLFRAAAFFAIGFLWAWLRADMILSQALAPALEGQAIAVEGTVSGLPGRQGDSVRFELDVTAVTAMGREWPSPGRIRLAWYHQAADPKPGESWRFAVKLKRPHGFMNPAGFDYEGWLFQQRMRATGYVLDSEDNTLLGPPRGELVNRVRNAIRHEIAGSLGETGPAAIITALAIGAQDGISSDQWRVLNRTGTSHLVAISGLHVGLVAGFGYFLGRWLWSLPGSTVLRLAAPRFGAVTGMLAALAYSALAGFAVPTQRTLIMIAVVMVGLFTHRWPAPLDLLLIALLLVLAVDPFAVMSPGFWLSFASVAFILYGMRARVGPHGLWWRYGRIHVVVAIGLTPVLLVLFGQNPLLGPLANLVAVPWVSFVVVPLVLAGTLLLSVWEGPGLWLLRAGADTLTWIWPYLSWLSSLDYASWSRPIPEPWVAGAACIGALLLLMPRGIPGRWLGLVWLLPLGFYPPARPGQGELWFTLLDVGQGLAAVVQTKDHVLVYDTGPKFSESFDTGRAVVVPYLRKHGTDRVDIVVISHGDNDHIGGLASLLDEISVGRVITSAPARVAHPRVEPCHDGLVWRWNDVEFRLLHPSPSAEVLRDNDRSCVLRIAVGDRVLLLPGDIERAAENSLLTRHLSELHAQILVVPHHGSRTSSTPKFVAAVEPEYVLFAVGYRNRFGFPRAEVLKRYADIGALALNTAEEGALQFRIGNTISAPERYRRTMARYWHGR